MMFASSNSSRLRARTATLGLLGALACGCQEQDVAPPRGREASGGGVVKGARDAGMPDCSGHDDGEPCGSSLHCIAETCVFNTCGDGVAAGDEECDDGNQSVGDQCNPACRLTPITCGNAHVEPGEECDDGNPRNDDACSNGCTLNRCGNARRDPGEECDDGNADDLDYCTAACMRNECRNGRLDPGEDCDDGNAVNNDGCTNDCRDVRCGDGTTYAEPGALFEECDDGNRFDNDACSNACTKNECGNNRTDPGEVCDGLSSANPDDPLAVCGSGCKGWAEDPCVLCMRDHCSGEFEGVDFFGPCLVEASGDNIFGAPYYAGFTQLCQDLDRCVRRNNCVDGQGEPVPCVCGTLSVTECEVAADDALNGPCVDEWIASMNNICPEANPKTAPCFFQLGVDISNASGYAFYLAKCRWDLCSTECGLNRR